MSAGASTKTYNYEQVGAVIGALKERFGDADRPERDACSKLGGGSHHCTLICREIIAAVNAWALAVFSDELIFDPAAELRWQSELKQLRVRAVKLWRLSRTLEARSYDRRGLNELGSALWNMQWLMDNWVTPQLAVSPITRARLNLRDEQKAEIRRQLSDLPPFERFVEG